MIVVDKSDELRQYGKQKGLTGMTTPTPSLLAEIAPRPDDGRECDPPQVREVLRFALDAHRKRTKKEEKLSTHLCGIILENMMCHDCRWLYMPHNGDICKPGGGLR